MSSTSNELGLDKQEEDKLNVLKSSTEDSEDEMTMPMIPCGFTPKPAEAYVEEPDKQYI